MAQSKKRVRNSRVRLRADSDQRAIDAAARQADVLAEHTLGGATSVGRALLRVICSIVTVLVNLGRLLRDRRSGRNSNGSDLTS